MLNRLILHRLAEVGVAVARLEYDAKQDPSAVRASQAAEQYVVRAREDFEDSIAKFAGNHCDMSVLLADAALILESFASRYIEDDRQQFEQGNELPMHYAELRSDLEYLRQMENEIIDELGKLSDTVAGLRKAQRKEQRRQAKEGTGTQDGPFGAARPSKKRGRNHK